MFSFVSSTQKVVVVWKSCQDKLRGMHCSHIYWFWHSLHAFPLSMPMTCIHRHWCFCEFMKIWNPIMHHMRSTGQWGIPCKSGFLALFQHRTSPPGDSTRTGVRTSVATPGVCKTSAAAPSANASRVATCIFSCDKPNFQNEPPTSCFSKKNSMILRYWSTSDSQEQSGKKNGPKDSWMASFTQEPKHLPEGRHKQQDLRTCLLPNLFRQHARIIKNLLPFVHAKTACASCVKVAKDSNQILFQIVNFVAFWVVLWCLRECLKLSVRKNETSHFVLHVTQVTVNKWINKVMIGFPVFSFLAAVIVMTIVHPQTADWIRLGTLYHESWRETQHVSLNKE